MKGTGGFFSMNCFLKVSIAFFLVVSLVTGCAERRAYSPPPKVVEKKLAHMGYTIQVGAFSHVENAVRLTDLLRDRGLEATYFAASVGLYKVSFGNYPSKVIAREKAENLKSSGVIYEYHIVTPDEYAIAKQQTHGNIYIREELIKTAQKFIAVPYLWGGS